MILLLTKKEWEGAHMKDKREKKKKDSSAKKYEKPALTKHAIPRKIFAFGSY